VQDVVHPLVCPKIGGLTIAMSGGDTISHQFLSIFGVPCFQRSPKFTYGIIWIKHNDLELRDFDVNMA